MKGRLQVSNHRNEAVTLVIKRRFSGELISADGKPRQVLREEGVYYVNERHDLVWEIKLGAGEKKEIGYTYSVLVSH